MVYSSGLNRKKPLYFGTEYSKQRNHSKSCGTQTDSLMCCVRILTRTVFVAALVQAQTSCCFGCKHDEVTWRSNDAAQNDTCLACIDCPDGTEPSIACGTVTKYGTHLHCVVCRDGTYSDTYGKEQCNPCTMCSVGRTISRNCSATKNTQCGSCRYGYYDNDFISDCLLCSVCCWDGRDQFEAQCKAQGLPRHRHCTPRHEGGCQPASTTTRATSGAITVHSNPATTQQTSESQLEETTVPHSPTTREHFTSNKTRDKITTSFALPTTAIQLRNETAPAKDNDKNHRTVDSSSENKSPVILAISLSIVILIMVTLFMIVIIAKRNKRIDFFKWVRCCPICRSSSDAELSRDIESCFLDDIKAQLNVVPKGVLISLSKLKSLSHVSYDRVWKRLDKQPEGTKMGDFRDVAEAFMFVQEDIWELEKELKTPGSGSPSRQLLEGLETRRPGLTVLEFIKVLQKPSIHRDDIVELLKDYIYR